MTAPVTQRFGLTALYRLLAGWSLLVLFGAYTGAVTIATVMHRVAINSDAPVTDGFAGLIALIALSLLFTVVT